MPESVDPPPGSEPRYVVITPARNEAERIQHTIDAMADQTVRPATWIVVDDGSTDGTADIVARAAQSHDWITLVSRDDRGHRAAGSGVVEAVNDGFAAVDDNDWEFLVKLDADLSFPSDYFARCFEAFEEDPTLGIAGGTVSNIDAEGNRSVEPHPDFHVRGATKIYRRTCWDQIGGLRAVPGWDTIDEVEANRMGWSTRTLPVPIDQLRTTGAAAGQWRNWVKNGRAAYLTGYHPLFLGARAASRARRSPYLTAAAGLLWGYGRSLATREDVAVSDATRRYVRSQQMNRLLGRDSIWR